MLDRFIEALTGRRLGGALFVLVGLVVVGAVFWPEHEDAPQPAKVQPVRIVSVPQLGLTFAHPRVWRRTIAARVIRLRSPDASAILTFATPTKGAHTRAVEADLKRALRERFPRARVVREGKAKLGARPARSVELDGIGAGGTQRVLVVVASSAFRTYTVTLLTPARPSAKRLAEAQQILATVRLVEPRAKPVVGSTG